MIFENLNNFFPNIKLAVEVNLEEFLDLKIILENDGVVAMQVHRK